MAPDAPDVPDPAVPSDPGPVQGADGPPRHVALVGVTASGKSALALDLARRDRTIELVSVDSMQVYRGMDIGTAKPTPAERAEVPHHLVDELEPGTRRHAAPPAGRL